MSLYLSPSFLDSGDTMRTTWMRAPLPFPGVDLVKNEAFVGLEATDLGFDQFEFIGTSSYPTSNICGSLRYRRFQTRFGGFTSEDVVLLGDRYGIRIFANATESSLTYRTWEEEVNYRFVDERDEDYVDPETGEHEERWKPVVETYFVTKTGPDSSGLSFSGVGVSATHKKYQYYSSESEDDEEVVRLVNRGSTTLSLLIDHKYFKPLISKWEDLPSSTRRRTNGGVKWGGVVATSDAEDGVTCYIGGGQWYASADLSEVSEIGDSFYERGWAGGVKVNVPHTHRKNAPVVRDNKLSSLESDIYRITVSEAILGEEIISYRWLDECGIYDPDGAATFSGMGWRPLEPATLDRVATVPPVAQGGASTGQLLSADGKTYRITLQVMGYDEGESEASVQKTVVVHAAAGDPGDFDLRLPDANTASISSVRVASIQRQTAGGGWESITVTSGMISHMPGAGVLLLCIAKIRRGSRWGFPQYYDAGWPDDVGDIFQSNEMRFFRKQLFRHKAKALTES